jgi:DNA adenine methylase
MSDRPRRTALRYYGGKAALASWIVAQFPAHQTYCESFGGAASVLLAKPRAVRETYNDLDGAVVSFFRCMRDQPDTLIRAIQLTPFARAEIDGADVDDQTITDLERARRLYVRSWQTIHGAPSRGRMGWRCEKAQTGGGTSADAWV